MLYIISGCYKPNTAATLRLLALVKGYSNLTKEYQLIFVYPNETFSKIDQESGALNVIYLWEKHKIKNKYLKYFYSFYDLTKYVSRLPIGSNLLLISANDYLASIIRHKDKFKIYLENTEHPSMVPLYPPIRQKKYLRDCLKVNGMFVISSALQSYYQKLGITNITMLNMVTDPNRFCDLRKNPHREKYIAYCGSATNNKDGVDILIQAFAIFSQRHSDYKLYIIGKSPEYSDDYNNLDLVKNLGIDNSVVFKGVVPSQDLPQMLLDAEFLVLARPDNLQAKYGFPTKLGEYLLTGNPVVVTDVGDISFFLKDKESALIAKPDNINDFAEKMIWLVEHKKISQEIGDRGKKIALQEFNGLIEAKKLYTVINNE